MKQIQLFSVGALVTLMLLSGCQKEAPPPAAAESFKVRSHTVKFSPPKEYTKKEPKTNGMVEALIFENPKGKGHIGLTVLDQASKEDKITKELLQPFVDPIYKRDGKLTLQKELDFAGGKDNGYRIEFQYGEGATQNKGVQVYYLSKGNLYSIVMTAPVDEFSQNLTEFDAVVKSFQIEK